MLGQPLGDAAAVDVVLPHAKSEGLGAAQREPAVERPGHGARRVLDEPDPLGEVVGVHDHHSADHVAVAVQVFGGRVKHDVGAQLERPLEAGRREGVVHDAPRVGVMRDLAHGLEVAQPHHRVGRRLGVDQPGAGRHGRGDVAGVSSIHEAEFQPVPGPDMGHLPVRAAVHVLAAHDVIPVRQQLEHGIHCGQPRGECEAVAAAFERCDVAPEHNIAALEGGRHGFAFASGLAAVDAVLKLLSHGDHVVSGENVYGGTHRQMTHIWARHGLEFSFVDAGDAGNVAAAVTPRTRLIYAETPTNPMMRLCDLQAVGEIAHDAHAWCVVDNTFATPCFQRPLELGADIVLHSTTKYLNGHSDMVGGVVVVNSDDLAERIGFIQNASGAVPGPFDCWLALRGTKTLALRMRQHDVNGRRVAEWLTKHPKVQRVYYPGLP